MIGPIPGEDDVFIRRQNSAFVKYQVDTSGQRMVLWRTNTLTNRILARNPARSSRLSRSRRSQSWNTGIPWPIHGRIPGIYRNADADGAARDVVELNIMLAFIDLRGFTSPGCHTIRKRTCSRSS